MAVLGSVGVAVSALAFLLAVVAPVATVQGASFVQANKLCRVNQQSKPIEGGKRRRSQSQRVTIKNGCTSSCTARLRCEHDPFSLTGGQLRIYLKNGQVRDADGWLNGDSDVYVRFYLGGSSTEQVVTSTLKEEDNTPTWNEWLTFSGNDIPAKVSLCVCVCLCICVCVCLCLLRDWFVLILPLFPLLLFSSQFSLFVEAYDSDTLGSEELVGCLSSAD